MTEKRKPALPSAMQVKNQRKTISIEEKLGVTSGLIAFFYSAVYS